MPAEGNFDGGLLCCDTPGVGDTEGTEVDVANAIAITAAIKTCSTLRIVLVMKGCTLTEHKGKITMQEILTITRTIKDLHVHIQSVLVLFTHCGVTFGHARLQRELEFLKSSQHFKSSPDAMLFLQHALSLLTQHGPSLIVDPTSGDNRASVVRILQSMTPISNPTEALNSPLTPHAESDLVRACERTKFSILEHLHSREDLHGGTLADDLGDLKALSSRLCIVAVEKAHADSANAAKDHALSLCQKATAALEEHAFGRAFTALSSVQGYANLEGHIEADAYHELKKRYLHLLFEVNKLARDEYSKCEESNIQPIDSVVGPLHVLRDLCKFLGQFLEFARNIQELGVNYTKFRKLRQG